MTARIVYEIKLTVRSPFLFQGLANVMLGVDAAALRNEDRHPIIPSDQIRGVLKEALIELAEAAPSLIKPKEIEALFGRPSPEKKDGEADAEQDRPDRGALHFSDLAARDFVDSACETTRVEIDDATGASKRGHIQVIELVAPFGAEATFVGKIVAFWGAKEAERLRTALAKALNNTLAIGAFKSAGFGEIVHDKLKPAITILEKPQLTLPKLPPVHEERRAYWVTFDRPFLVDARRIADNVLLGAAIIPGGAFKGALAERLKHYGQNPEDGPYAAALSALRFCHAFPENKDGQPSGAQTPLSLVQLKDGDNHVFGDALGVPYGKGARIKKIESRAPLFRPDWKDDVLDPALLELGYPAYDDPEHLPRTHTAIKTDIAETERLYTTVARSPRRPRCWSDKPDKPSEPRRWLLVVDGGEVADKAKLACLFALLEKGLEPIGRTEARAEFMRSEARLAVPPEPEPLHNAANRFAIVLKTPALIADPLGDGDTRKQYESYFEQVCPGASLVNFFASQRWAGRYLAVRRRPYGKAYYPFALTEEGSVFLIEAANGQIDSVRKTLSRLARCGLPLPALEKADPLNWRNCPFVPENGFGEITADYLSVQRDAKRLERVIHV